MSSPRILIIDDTEANRYVLKRHLRRAGFEIMEAATGSEGLSLAKTGPDLIILDVKLPDIVGYDVCRMLKSDPATGTIPVLQVSATFRMASDKVKGLEAGADGYLTGPVEADELIANVRLLLRLRQAEETFRKSQEQFREAFAHAPIGMVLMDLEGHFVHVNRAYCDIVGYSEKELLQPKFDFKQITHADDLERNVEAFDRLVSGAIPSFFIEKRYIRKDGRVVWVRASASLRHDAGGRPTQAVGLVEDITARKEAEEKLRKRETTLAQARQMAHLGAWEIEFELPEDSDQNPLTWSPEVYDIFGLDPSSGPVTRQRFFERIPAEDRPRVAQTVAEAIAQRRPYKIEHRVMRPDGTERYVREQAEVVYDANGRPIRMVGAVQDITEAKLAERALHQAKEELAEVNANLEQLVRERTAQLEDLVGELEHFSYSITHDMRAPLRAMRGFAELLIEECGDLLDEPRKNYLQRIAGAADRMDQLIIDALDYSKAVRQELVLTPVDPKALLRAMVESYPAFQRPRAEVHIDENIPRVMANEAGLTQCFSNLLGNAVKFVEPGVIPVVRVWSEEVPCKGEQRCVRLWFEDNGIGIPQECHDRIFRMFQRVSKTFEGTGIGLALVRKVAERMGGRVGLESESGQGSRFWLELRKAPG